MPVSNLEYVISPSDIKQFEDEGYLVLDNIFTDAELQVVIDAINKVVDERSKTAVKEGKLSRDYAEEDFEHRLTKINDENHHIASGMWDQQVILPEFYGLIANRKLVDIAEQLCKSDELIASSVYRLRPKVPRHPFSVVPWHQDSGYFEPKCDMDLILTVWIPLVNATKENGCMWALPKLHKGAVMQHEPDSMAHYIQIKDERINDPSQWVCCPVKKGGAFLVTNRTPHASFENKTEICRWSMDLRYQAANIPTNAKITHSTANIKLDSDGVPLACNPPEPDFLVRSTLHPDQVLKSAQDFVNLRLNHKYKEMTDRWGYSVADRKEIDNYATFKKNVDEAEK